jgi:hypothetical protein
VVAAFAGHYSNLGRTASGEENPPFFPFLQRGKEGDLTGYL